MNNKQQATDKTDYGRHPLIRQVAELTVAATGSRLLIVYPVDSGWAQAHGDTHTKHQPVFCSLIQSSPEGAKHCHMCHIMMTVAACSGGPSEQICHAGASVLVCPAADPSTESMAVLSCCIFSSDGTWDMVRQRGEKLGVDLRRLRKTFLNLPQLDEGRLRVLKLALQTMSCALREVHQNRLLNTRLSEANRSQEPAGSLTKFLNNTLWAKRSNHLSSDGQGNSLLVRVVSELVQQRPDLPLTVKELAAAAGLTPNHFSTLFRKHAGASFNEYLTKQRIARAQKLLLNPTLSINEIARLTGYDDPGYFTRRFHQETRLSPREWRNRKAGLEAQSD